MATSLDEIQSQGLFRRILDSEEISSTMRDYRQSLQWAVEAFGVSTRVWHRFRLSINFMCWIEKVEGRIQDRVLGSGRHDDVLGRLDEIRKALPVSQNVWG